MNDELAIAVYSDGEIEITTPLKEDTVWITQKQLSSLFGVEVHTVNYHIKNIFKQNELSKMSTIRKIRIVQQEGKREVVRSIEHYNLDIIISVGYRINSIKATRFRQWATKILKQYITNGYAINSEKITHQRFVELESDINTIKKKINTIDELIVSSNIEVKQGVFFEGQIFDAYNFMNDILRSADKEVILIDNYIDDTILTLFSKYPNINFTIITKTISKQFNLDIAKYNAQYKNVCMKMSNKYHDRFLIIDKINAYHIGASLKDLGKKVFGFSKIDIKLIMDDTYE